MAEKRNFVRYTVDGNTNLKIKDFSDDSFVIEVSNISFAGAGIYSNERGELENKILHFEISSQLQGEVLVGTGRIKYIIKIDKKGSPSVYRMGLEFVDINRSGLLGLVNKLQEIHSSKVRKVQRVTNKRSGYTGLF